MKIYKNHGCTSRHRLWRTLAKCMFPRAAWIAGEGPYALIAWCHVLTVTLWTDVAAAEQRKEFIDRTGCGGRCTQRHEVIALRNKEAK